MNRLEVITEVANDGADPDSADESPGIQGELPENIGNENADKHRSIPTLNRSKVGRKAIAIGDYETNWLDSDQNFVTSVKLKSCTFMAGTTISKDSSPLARTGSLIASTLESI